MNQHQNVIEASILCARLCEECCAMCIEEDHPDCVKVTGDCAHICWTLSSFMGRSSEFSPSLAKVCEEICEACAGECSKYDDSGHHMRCADAARNCAAECRNLTPSALHNSVHSSEGANW